jgi:hypothetical protein
MLAVYVIKISDDQPPLIPSAAVVPAMPEGSSRVA